MFWRAAPLHQRPDRAWVHNGISEFGRSPQTHPKDQKAHVSSPVRLNQHPVQRAEIALAPVAVSGVVGR